MAFQWASAGAGASDALQQLLAKRMEDQLAQARLEAEQQRMAQQASQFDANMGLQQRQEDRLAAGDKAEQARYDAGANLRGLQMMQAEAALMPKETPKKLMTPLKVRGANNKPVYRQFEEGDPALAEGVEAYEAPRQSQGTQSDNAANGMLPLAEMTARSGQLPEGTPTQSGAIMQRLASNPALRAQYEEKRMEPIRAQAQVMRTAIDDLLGEDGELTPGGQALFGEMTPVFTRQMGVKSATVAANASLRQIVGQRVVDLIREMKDQSKTGATGFGQLNKAELDIILSAATRLTQRIPEATAKQELSTLREKFDKILQPADGSGTNGSSVSDAAAKARDLIKRYGGAGAGR